MHFNFWSLIKKIMLATIPVLLVLNSGCQNKNDEDAAQPLALTANLGGATALAITVSSSSTSFVASKSRRLKRKDNSGSFSDVLNLTRDSYFQILTTTHVIVTGNFTDIKASDGSKITCYLIAFPKTSTDEVVRCLSQSSTGTFWTYDDINGFYDNHGVATDGTNVFWVTGGKLQKWDGTGDSVQTLITVTVGSTEAGFDDVYVSTNQQNICVTRPALNLHKGQVICGQISSGTYSNINLGTSSWSSRAIRINNKLMSWDKTIDLDSLTVSDQTNPIPAHLSRMVSASSTEAILIDEQNGRLVKVSDTGAVSVIDDTLSWNLVKASGGYLYAYSSGGGVLKRMNLSQATLEATNYLASYGMLTVDDFSISLDGATELIRINGTSTSGSQTVVYINAATGSVHSVSSQLPALERIINL